MLKKRGLIIFTLFLVLLFVIQGCTTNAPTSSDGILEDEIVSEDIDEKQDAAEENNGGNISEIGEEEDSAEDEGLTDGDSINSSDKQDENNGDKEGTDIENIVYISADRLNVRQEPFVSAPKIGQLMKGAGVAVLETSIGQDEKEWLKISFDNGNEKTTGWIAAEYTVKNRIEALDEQFRNLDFSAQDKVDEYPDNPRVKVRGIYLTIHSASGSRLDSLIEMAKRTNINAFVIDVKDDNGYMLFPTKAAEKFAPKANEKAPVRDINAFMKKLKDNGIYTIARIVTFKDPVYTETYPDKAIIDKRTGKPHTNNDGLRWASPYDRQLWEYDVAVAKEAAEVGFNEIQFDYVRFPASNGGKLDSVLDYRNNRGETKPQAIQDFLKYAYKELSPYQVYIAADVYGLVGSAIDDMGIGQYWEAISNVVDYICPMMYPSHYANHTYGLPVPDAYPYETIYHSIRDSLLRNNNIETPAIIRPWIQDFTASWVKGHIRYGEAEVRAQIKALEENGIDEFMLWNPNNIYTEEALR